MNIEIYLSVLGALCTFRVFDYLMYRMSNAPQKKVTKNIDIYCGKTEDLPDFLKDLLKNTGKDDDDD